MSFGTVRCPCQHCSGWLEFPRLQVGQQGICPHCQLETLLFEAPDDNYLREQARADAAAEQQQKARINRRRWIIGGSITGIVALMIVAGRFLSSKEGEVLGQIIFAVVGLFVAGFIYFLPSIVGRNKANAQAILVLNFFLGWTLLGWVIALVWASTVEKPIKE